MCFMPLPRNGESMFLILFLLMEVYFYLKLIVFLCEHVDVFTVNSVFIMYFKTLCKLYKYLFSVCTNW